MVFIPVTNEIQMLLLLGSRPPRLPMVSSCLHMPLTSSVLRICIYSFNEPFLGYSSEILAQAPIKPPGSSRLKGKARKAAKASVLQAPVLRTGRKYRIAIKDFPVLANFILGEKTISIPESVYTTLDRLIAARGEFGSLLYNSGKDVDKEADGKHSHFLDVLIKVREVLKAHSSTKTTTKASSSEEQSKAKVPKKVNRFADLEMYDPSDDFLNAPDIVRPVQNAADIDTYEAETEDTLFDTIFALNVMVNDLNRIRSRIKWIWSNYTAGGRFRLPAAAIATNAAIDLARNISDAVIPLTEAHGGAWKCLNVLFNAQALQQGKVEAVNRVVRKGQEAHDTFNYDYYDLGTNLFVLPYRMVEEFSQVLTPNALPLYTEGMVGTYDLQEDREAKTGYSKFLEDRAILMPTLSDLMIAVRQVEFPVQDEFLRAMGELHHSGKVPFSLVFSAQVFLDIIYTLKAKTVFGFNEFDKAGKFWIAEIDKHLDFHKNLKLARWPPNNDHFLRQKRDRIRYILDDPVYQFKCMGFKQTGTSMPITVERNRILKNSPVLSGLLIFRFASEIREMSKTIMDCWGSVLFSAHLYQATGRAGLIGRWPDMDVAMAVVGMKNFFIGDPPTTMNDSLKKFMLQTGVSAAAMSGSRRLNAPKLSKKGPKGKSFNVLITSPVFVTGKLCFHSL